MSDNITHVTPDDLEGLPAELIDQLALSDADKADHDVLATLRAIGGPATMDAILVTHYRFHDEVVARPTMQTRLGRLVAKSLAVRIEGKQGVYSIPAEPPTLTDQVDEPNSFEPDGDEASAG